ncbi:uncharacterized protein LOC106660805 [Cimex lectularius]|uniref:Uncharacterized protein n=1 Tax=Cimex lectularius TaxID=79782 RepID=A0A8I6R5R7_CIMLE|nr:uncharacterized protein LOC106660805 [Cimex lectularius]
MAACKCPTINLAKVSIQALKLQESKLQKLPVATRDIKCRTPYPIPPPPRLIKYKTIQICQAPPIDFIHPALPCICPPCPICPTKAERLQALLKLVGKFYVLYFLFQLANAGEFWGSADASAELVTSISNLILRLSGSKEQFKGHKIGFFQVDKIKYNLLTFWDKLVFTVFWYSVGLPAKYYNDIANQVNRALFYKECPCKLKKQEELAKQNEEKSKKK